MHNQIVLIVYKTHTTRSCNSALYLHTWNAILPDHANYQNTMDSDDEWEEEVRG